MTGLQFSLRCGDLARSYAAMVALAALGCGGNAPPAKGGPSSDEGRGQKKASSSEPSASQDASQDACKEVAELRVLPIEARLAPSAGSDAAVLATIGHCAAPQGSRCEQIAFEKLAVGFRGGEWPESEELTAARLRFVAACSQLSDDEQQCLQPSLGDVFREGCLKSDASVKLAAAGGYTPDLDRMPSKGVCKTVLEHPGAELSNLAQAFPFAPPMLPFRVISRCYLESGNECGLAGAELGMNYRNSLLPALRGHSSDWHVRFVRECVDLAFDVQRCLRPSYIWDHRDECAAMGATAILLAALALPDAGADESGAVETQIFPSAPERVTLVPARKLSHGGDVLGLSFSPDGARLATASNDGHVRDWDAKTGALRRTIRGHSDGVTGTAWSPDGSAIASSSFDGSIRLWDADTGVQRWARDGLGRMREVAFHPDGSLYASGDRHVVMQLDASNGKTLSSFNEDQAGFAWGMALSPDGSQVVTLGGGVVRVFSNDGDARPWKGRADSAAVWEIAFSPTGAFVAFSGPDSSSLLIIRADTGEPVSRKQVTGAWLIPSVAWAKNGLVAAGDSTGKVTVFHPDRPKPLAQVQAFKKNLIALSFSPDSTRLAAGGYDNAVQLWTVSTR